MQEWLVTMASSVRTTHRLQALSSSTATSDHDLLYSQKPVSIINLTTQTVKTSLPFNVFSVLRADFFDHPVLDLDKVQVDYCKGVFCKVQLSDLFPEQEETSRSTVVVAVVVFGVGVHTRLRISG